MNVKIRHHLGTNWLPSGTTSCSLSSSICGGCHGIYYENSSFGRRGAAVLKWGKPLGKFFVQHTTCNYGGTHTVRNLLWGSYFLARTVCGKQQRIWAANIPYVQGVYVWYNILCRVAVLCLQRETPTLWRLKFYDSVTWWWPQCLKITSPGKL